MTWKNRTLASKVINFATSNLASAGFIKSTTRLHLCSKNRTDAGHEREKWTQERELYQKTDSEQETTNTHNHRPEGFPPSGALTELVSNRYLDSKKKKKERKGCRLPDKYYVA